MRSVCEKLDQTNWRILIFSNSSGYMVTQCLYYIPLMPLHFGAMMHSSYEFFEFLRIASCVGPNFVIFLRNFVDVFISISLLKLKLSHKDIKIRLMST